MKDIEKVKGKPLDLGFINNLVGGESVFIHGVRTNDHEAQRIRAVANVAGKKLKLYTEDEGARVWRVS